MMIIAVMKDYEWQFARMPALPRPEAPGGRATIRAETRQFCESQPARGDWSTDGPAGRRPVQHGCHQQRPE
jgi:hypothetical protein